MTVRVQGHASREAVRRTAGTEEVGSLCGRGNGEASEERPDRRGARSPGTETGRGAAAGPDAPESGPYGTVGGGEVRRELREFLRHRSGAERIEEAELLLSELVTNALIHTRHGAVVTATASPAALRVEVQDFEADLPAPYVPNADDGTHGRG